MLFKTASSSDSIIMIRRVLFDLRNDQIARQQEIEKLYNVPITFSGERKIERDNKPTRRGPKYDPPYVY